MAGIPIASRAVPTHEALPSGLSYLAVYGASQGERVDMIKAGVPASEAKRLIGDLALGDGVTFAALDLSASTVNRKAARGEILTLDEGERVLGLARLVGQVQTMVEHSGRPEGFDAIAWLADWLAAPLPAFGGRRPLDFLDTMEGQELVRDTLIRAQSGTYA